MVGSGAPGTRFSQTLLKTQERVKTHTGAILVCLLLLCFASIARSRSFVNATMFDRYLPFSCPLRY
ncbi:hypothetical protein, partial [Escherichia coli]|uniref:hypothetical protein n=1 Tax=Escherichia coli TaxID=562 RepID=UPI000D078FE8